jgi:VCBS repeat-containing protein
MPRTANLANALEGGGRHMKRAVGILSIAVVSVFLVAGARADNRYGSAERKATSGTSASNAGFVGQHMMTGTIKDIDRDEGTVSLEAEGGQDLALHFPKIALQNLSKGDRVTVQMAIKKVDGSRSGTSRSGGGMR